MGITLPYYHIYRHGPASVTQPFSELRESAAGMSHFGAYELLKRDLRKLFEYIEPVPANATTFSHRTFEILLRACTEVEAHCKQILEANEQLKDEENIKRYSDLEGPMRLSEYEIICIESEFSALKPFASFTKVKRDERSPDWYRAYNKVKHHRSANFPEATLLGAVNAVAAVHILLNAQFGVHFDGHLNLQSGGHTYKPDLFRVRNQLSWTPDEQYQFSWDELKKAGGDPWSKHPIPKRP